MLNQLLSLQLIFSQYGEVRNAKTLAEAIVSARDRKPILTIGDFLNVLNPCVRGHRPSLSFSGISGTSNRSE